MHQDPSFASSDAHADDQLHHVHHAVRHETGRTIHKSTGIRWCTRGVRGIRLKAVRMGRYRMTSRKMVRQFLAALTAADMDAMPEPTPETHRERSDRAAAAKRRAADALS